ncbi:MAG TPA: NCS1 family nucleobase:cation symporter-1 [Candidatus Competibacteraceae bacterium]|nr:NCS1 family nucleobase:cation symporter-1 [Candidatus Competibacteraceae bacterium]
MPTTARERTWEWRHFAALWVGMVVCVPTYTLAAGLIAGGMSLTQAVLTVFLGNLIVLVPMLLIGHAGAKHGVPYPVLARASFGVLGARLPAMLRAVVACGWFGIQTWIGGMAIYQILNILTGDALRGTPLGYFGADLGQLACFLVFWAIHLYFIKHGTESIRWLETWSAPVLLVMGVALLGWAWMQAGDWSKLLGQPATFQSDAEFWAAFWPSLTAMVGFWATLALNIPDFTRFAKSQKDQVLGQALGLPIPMGFFAFIGAAVASATLLVYGKAIWDPVELAGHMGGFAVVLALLLLIIATLTTNIAANVVSPAYDFSILAPQKIDFARGGYITAAVGILMHPWFLLGSLSGYIFTWLIGYSGLLGPIAGILLADYYLVRQTELDATALYRRHGEYAYGGSGWNPAALIAFALGVLPNVPGFLQAASNGAIQVPAFLNTLYGYAWFVGLGIAFVVYLGLMAGKRRA